MQTHQNQIHILSMLLPEKAKQIQRRKSEAEFSWRGRVFDEEVGKCCRVRRNSWVDLDGSRDRGASSPFTVSCAHATVFNIYCSNTGGSQAMGHSETLF